MGIEQLVTLAGLALIDSTSFGTLVIPILLIVATRRVSWAAMAVYLGTVVAFYFVVGLLLLLGLNAALDAVEDLVSSTTGAALQLILGVALFALSWPLERRMKRAGGRGNRLAGMTQRPAAMVTLAVSATLVEVAMMVPYLGAIGILTASDEPFAVTVPTLFAYCLVMILPAVILIGLASLVGEGIWGRLERFGAWMDRQSAGAVSWIVGGVGVLLALNAAGRLFN